jgi:hypothetical protein
MNHQRPHIKSVIETYLIRFSLLFVSFALIGCASTQLPKSIFEVNRLEDDRSTLTFSRSNDWLASACIIDLYINDIKVSELAKGEEWKTNFLRPGRYSVKTVNGSPWCGSLGATNPQQINVLPNSIHALALKAMNQRFHLVHTVIYEPSLSPQVRVFDDPKNQIVTPAKDSNRQNKINNNSQENKCLRLGLSKNSVDYKLCINSALPD